MHDTSDLKQFTGLYDSGSIKNPIRVWAANGGRRFCLGNFSTVNDALEAYNNAAFWLGQDGRGINISLQGSQELQDLYNLRYHSLEEMPPPTEKTQEFLAWADSKFKRVEEPKCQPASVPGALLLGLRRQAARVLSDRQRSIESYQAQLEEIYAMQSALDPQVIEAIKTRDSLLAYMQDNPNNRLLAAYEQELEKLYAKFPAARPA